jgi:hypothetical protein
MKIILVGIMLGMFLVFSNIHVSNSYLQHNLLVKVKPEKTMINPNDFSVIVGKVTDEASKPVSNAHVMIAFGKEYEQQQLIHLVILDTNQQYLCHPVIIL